jgi:hypothetical protein
MSRFRDHVTDFVELQNPTKVCAVQALLTFQLCRLWKNGFLEKQEFSLLLLKLEQIIFY